MEDENIRDASNLQTMRQGPSDPETAEDYIEMYEEEENLDPEYLDGLRGKSKIAKLNRKKAIKTFGLGFVETDDTHYSTFENTLDSLGADTEKEIGESRITINSSEKETSVYARGNDIALEMETPLRSANRIRYEFEDEVPEELTDLDKAMVGYSWQFFEEPRRDRAGRKLRNFVDETLSKLG